MCLLIEAQVRRVFGTPSEICGGAIANKLMVYYS